MKYINIKKIKEYSYINNQKKNSVFTFKQEDYICQNICIITVKLLKDPNSENIYEDLFQTCTYCTV